MLPNHAQQSTSGFFRIVQKVLSIEVPPANEGESEDQENFFGGHDGLLRRETSEVARSADVPALEFLPAESHKDILSFLEAFPRKKFLNRCRKCDTDFFFHSSQFIKSPFGFNLSFICI